MARPHAALLDLVARGETRTQLNNDALHDVVRHGLVGFLHERSAAGQVELAADFAQSIAIRHLATTSDVTARIDALADVVRKIDGRARVGVGKGLAFSAQFYDSPWTRTGSDVDLYFGPEALLCLGELIGSLDPQVDVALFNWLGTSGRNFEHGVIVSGCRFDIHRDVVNAVLPMRQAALLWSDHTVPLDLPGGPPVWTLDLELSLVLALVNAARDGYATLKQLLDVRLTLDRDPEWERLLAFVDVEGWRPILSNSLDVACELLDRSNPVPPSAASRRVFRRIAPPELWLGGGASDEGAHGAASDCDRFLARCTTLGARTLTRRAVAPLATNHRCSSPGRTWPVSHGAVAMATRSTCGVATTSTTVSITRS